MTMLELIHQIEVPEPVVKQINEVTQLCKNSNGRIDIEDAARVMDREKRSLLNSMMFNHCPFGFVSSDNARHATVPVAKFYMWFMCDIINQVVSHDQYKN